MEFLNENSKYFNSHSQENLIYGFSAIDLSQNNENLFDYKKKMMKNLVCYKKNIEKFIKHVETKDEEIVSSTNFRKKSLKINHLDGRGSIKTKENFPIINFSKIKSVKIDDILTERPPVNYKNFKDKLINNSNLNNVNVNKSLNFQSETDQENIAVLNQVLDCIKKKVESPKKTSITNMKFNYNINKKNHLNSSIKSDSSKEDFNISSNIDNLSKFYSQKNENSKINLVKTINTKNSNTLITLHHHRSEKILKNPLISKKKQGLIFQSKFDNSIINTLTNSESNEKINNKSNTRTGPLIKLSRVNSNSNKLNIDKDILELSRKSFEKMEKKQFLDLTKYKRKVFLLKKS